jgi:[ribosomal protein S5]-alanine N-acetyltransferase
MNVQTPRLFLEPLTTGMMERRLAAADYSLPCHVDGAIVNVYFPRAWPGAAVATFERKLRLQRLGDDSALLRTFVAITRDSHRAVGLVGAVGAPDARRAQEIGYGFNEESWGRGFATEAVIAVARLLTTEPDITMLTARTSPLNAASERVLEKAGFERVGVSWNEEGGDLTIWEQSPRR